MIRGYKELRVRYLRFDMYINDVEHLLYEGKNFEDALWSSDLIDDRIADDIRNEGVSNIPLEYRSSEVLDILRDWSGFDVESNMTVNFCMCIWDDDPDVDDAHIMSAATLSDWQSLS